MLFLILNNYKKILCGDAKFLAFSFGGQIVCPYSDLKLPTFPLIVDKKVKIFVKFILLLNLTTCFIKQMS